MGKLLDTHLSKSVHEEETTRNFFPKTALLPPEAAILAVGKQECRFDRLKPFDVAQALSRAEGALS
jgi:hypothetical protein